MTHSDLPSVPLPIPQLTVPTRTNSTPTLELPLARAHTPTHTCAHTNTTPQTSACLHGVALTTYLSGRSGNLDEGRAPPPHSSRSTLRHSNFKLCIQFASSLSPALIGGSTRTDGLSWTSESESGRFKFPPRLNSLARESGQLSQSHSTEWLLR